MTVALLNNCRFECLSAGLVDFLDGPSVTGFRNLLDASAVDGSIYPYRAENADKSEWENGLGSYDLGGGVLQRSTVLQSSNAGAKVDFADPPTVFITILKEFFRPFADDAEIDAGFGVDNPLNTAGVVRAIEMHSPLGNPGGGAAMYPPVLTRADFLLDAASYIPTLTHIANLDDSAVSGFGYERNGSSVGLYGVIMVNPTVATTLTKIRISLPPGLTSNFSDRGHAGGTACIFDTGKSGAVYADTASDLIEISFICGTDTGAQFLSVIARYQIH